MTRAPLPATRMTNAARGIPSRLSTTQIVDGGARHLRSKISSGPPRQAAPLRWTQIHGHRSRPDRILSSQNSHWRQGCQRPRLTPIPLSVPPRVTAAISSAPGFFQDFGPGRIPEGLASTGLMSWSSLWQCSSWYVPFDDYSISHSRFQR